MNGSSSGDSTVFPNSVVFNCDPGFILNGSSSRRCEANGTWSGLSVTCVGRFEKKNASYLPIYTFFQMLSVIIQVYFFSQHLFTLNVYFLPFIRSNCYTALHVALPDR